MTDGYEYDLETSESFDDLEFAEAARPSFLRPMRPMSVAAAGGLSTATLHTPRGPATLTLPSTVPTLAQFRSLEQGLNANTQRVNAMQAELARMRRELLVSRRRGQQGQGTPMLMFMLLAQRKLRGDLEEHTHAIDATGKATGKAVIPTSSQGALGSLLPLLLFMQPGIFGRSTGSQEGGGLESILPLIVLGDVFK
jgi:hypothetical protein